MFELLKVFRAGLAITSYIDRSRSKDVSKKPWINIIPNKAQSSN